MLETGIGGLGALLILLFTFGTLPAIAMPLVMAAVSILNTFTLVWLLTRHAGRSVIVSGTTVAVGLLSMIVLPLPFTRSIGVGGMLIPAVSVLTAITLLPALP